MDGFFGEDRGGIPRHALPQSNQVADAAMRFSWAGLIGNGDGLPVLAFRLTTPDGRADVEVLRVEGGRNGFTHDFATGAERVRGCPWRPGQLPG